ncbi:uncharacterized protein LOC122001211 isoform X2 [Zingiber officinale]|uniref:uncharacterized protein LOC122001211 isoform X2 n=1 Tax=Zingiber officinale TaxID=94328 RepID=UPI001C4D93F8|nr:uncharacterized protein LOC122001211 isoform X2 [Zingiber officinale]
MEKPHGRLSAASSSSSAPSPTSSFASLQSYGRALAQTHRRLRRRAGSVTTTYEEMSRVRARSGADMDRSLRWLDLVGFGIGGMVGAGVFVATGRAAKLYAGPAIVLSYAIAGLCALLSSFCYTEFAVDMPVAGGAFSYLRVTFGEFAAFLTGANLIMEYVSSNAAVARSFTAYLGSAIGVDTTAKCRFTVAGLPEGFNQIDLLAVAVILLISICICYSDPHRLHPLYHRRGVLAWPRPQPDPPGESGGEPRWVPALWGCRSLQRRRHGLPQLHRLRRRLHHGGGGAPPCERHPHRHLRLRRRCHAPLLPHGRLDVHACPLRRHRHGVPVLGGVRRNRRMGMGVEGDRSRSKLRNADLAPSCHVGTSSVRLRHWTVRSRPCLARKSQPEDLYSRQRLGLPRSYYGGDRSLHRPERPPQPRLHRHPLRLLHGRQRRHLPPLRRRRLHRSAADRLLPARLLRRLPRLHAAMEARSGRHGQGGAPRRLRRSGRRLAAGVPVPGAGGEEARALGVAADAVDSGRLHFPQRLPAGVAGRPVVLEVRRLLGLRRGRLRLLQCAFQLRRRRKWRSI